MLSLPGCSAVGKLWNWARSSHLNTSLDGTASLQPWMYPSGSFLTPWVLHHSSISALHSCCASFTLHLSVSSLVLVVAMNIEGGRSTMSELSFSPWSAPGGLDGMSGAMWIFPGKCLIIRL